MEHISVAIVAGGRSSRFKTNKVWHEFDGVPLIQRQVLLLRQFTKHLTIVTRDEGPFSELGCDVVCDLPGVECSLTALRTALTSAATDDILVIACDYPLLDGATIQFLCTRSYGEHLAIVPRVNGQMQPLCARYRRVVDRHIQRAFTDNELSLNRLLKRFPTKTITCDMLRANAIDPLRLLNLNSRADLINAEQSGLL